MSRTRSIVPPLLSLVLFSASCGRTTVPDFEPTTPGPSEEIPDGDAGIYRCDELDDCAPFGFGQPCETLEGCGCGTFYTCHQARCVSYSVECRDSGVTPGPDAGPADTGVLGCRSVSDCESSNGIALGCTDVEVRSCIDHRCITECRAAARTCEVLEGDPNEGQCLVCEDGSRDCVNHCAAINMRALYEVEQTSCDRWPSSGQPVLGSLLISTDDRGPTCSYVFAHEADGRELGPYHLQWSFEYLAFFSELGGTCTGTMLPTGLERIHFGCPDCFIRLVRIQ